MTSDAQQALRRTMERYTETCRFILIANYSGKIIEPIQSRCAPFRFTYLPKAEHDEFLRRIAKSEGITLTDEGLEAIFYVCSGDMRRAINTLQAAASLGKSITAEIVYSVVGRAHRRCGQRGPLPASARRSCNRNGAAHRSALLKFGRPACDTLAQNRRSAVR